MVLVVGAFWLLLTRSRGWSLAQPDPEILAGLNAWPDGLQILFRERLRAHISQGVSDPQIEQIVEASRVSAFDLHFAIRGSTLPASAANAAGNYPNF